MPHYERENAKEWQLNLSNKAKRESTTHSSSVEDEEEENSWTQVQSSRRAPKTQPGTKSSTQPLKKDNVAPAKGPLSHAAIPIRPVLKDQPGQSGAKTRVTTGITFAEKADNAARSAFRRGKAHDGIYVLKQTCEKIEPSRVKMYNRLEEIGVRFGTFIRPPQFLLDR